MVMWYQESFGHDYLTVYKHRDFQGAYREVQRMVSWLQLPPGAEILDLCCGMGRHSLALADSGYRVTGVDLSEVLLEEARRHDQFSRVTWIRGDMRQVPLHRDFDAVVNLFTSFGYFDRDEENARVLKEIDRLLKPGGKFIIDYLNPQYVTEHLVPYSERVEGDLRIEEKRAVEDGCVRKKITIHKEDGSVRTYLEQVKLYGLHDFQRMLDGTDLQLDRVYGNYENETFVPHRSQRMILVGRKKEPERE